MRRLLLLCLVLPALSLGAQATIDPGMSRAAVIARLGKPLLERTLGDDTYVFYRNGCEQRCGMNDVVTLRHDAVVDAVFRSPRRAYSGISSSPRSIPAAEARRGRPTPRATPDGAGTLSLSVTATHKASLYDRLGGLPAVQAAVHEMVANAMADVRIKAFFAGIDMVRVDKNLVDFVCSAAGGPCVYHGKSMSKAHEGLNLKAEHFNALVEDLQKGLDKLQVPAAEQKELLAALAATRTDVLGK
ncbi:MAG: globin domain-containing protein [Gemmatimonadaceae bacterium]